MKANFLTVFFLVNQAVAGIFSQADRMTYLSDVVYPTAYQNFILTFCQKHVSVTPLQCYQFRTDVLLLKNQIDFLRKQIKKSKEVFVEVPKEYEKVVRFFFNSFKNVHIQARPVPYVIFKFCREVKK